MARPSPLSPEQWAEVDRRAAEGESNRSIARSFGVDEAAIRRRVNPHTPRIKEVAETVVRARQALATLPTHQQYVALNLADKLRSISSSLADAAELGAKTSHRLSALANAEVSKIDDADPLSNQEALKGVALLTRMANDSSSIAVNLLAANRDRVARAVDDEPQEEGAAPAVAFYLPQNGRDVV